MHCGRFNHCATEKKRPGTGPGVGVGPGVGPGRPSPPPPLAPRASLRGSENIGDIGGIQRNGVFWKIGIILRKDSFSLLRSV